jgi:hypothetical protein
LLLRPLPSLARDAFCGPQRKLAAIQRMLFHISPPLAGASNRAIASRVEKHMDGLRIRL